MANQYELYYKNGNRTESFVRGCKNSAAGNNVVATLDLQIRDETGKVVKLNDVVTVKKIYVGTENSLKINKDITNVLNIADGGTATSATTVTLVDTGKSWTVDTWIGYYIRIDSGTGSGQKRLITDSDATSVTVATWTTTPDNTSVYVIEGYFFHKLVAADFATDADVGTYLVEVYFADNASPTKAITATGATLTILPSISD